VTAAKHHLAALAAPAHTAVIVVDVQRVFAELPLYPPVPTVLAQLRRLLDEAREFAVPIIFVRVVVPPELVSDVWVRQFPHYEPTRLAPSSRNVEFAAGFQPHDGDLVVTKHRYSAFVGTPLAAMLRARGIQTVVLTGLTTDVCVGSTARDAFQRDYNVITLADCTAEMTRERYESALATLAETFGMVCTSEDAIAAWRQECTAT
jgi:ureidoacrylate peracid hydrolase